MSDKLAYLMSTMYDDPVVIPMKYDENNIVNDILKQLKCVKYKYKIVPIGSDNDANEQDMPVMDEEPEMPIMDEEPEEP